MSFEANRGQASADAKFISRGDGYQLFLTPQEAIFALSRTSKQSKNSLASDGRAGAQAANEQAGVLRMQVVNANPEARMEGFDELQGKVNYFVGNNPASWLTDAPTYARVRVANIYPNINLVYYGNRRQLEYDFEVAPGADPSIIKLAFQGADRMAINRRGELLLTTPYGTFNLHRPIVYQEVNGKRKIVPSGYALTNKNQISFKLGNYDRRKPLVIDPTLAYSTYLGGNNYDEADAISVDADGNAYIAGRTTSTDFPASGIQSTSDSLGNAFVVKLNAAGSAMLYATYFGGSRYDQAYGVAIDSSGNAYITGVTASTNFPIVNPIQAAKNGVNFFDAFVVKLNPTGSALVYSTYLGGVNSDGGRAIAVGKDGSAYVTGFTISLDFPTANPLQAAKSGSPSYKSTDATGQWSENKSGLAASVINSLVIDPTNPSTLYAATDTDVSKTTNGGATWSVVGAGQLQTPVLKLAIDRKNPSTLYAITLGLLYKSTDGGNNWSQLSLSNTPHSIAIDPSNSSTLYVGSRSFVFKSTDGGAHFSSAILVGNSSAGAINALVVDPSNASIVWAGTDRGVYRSTNAGINWTATNSFGPYVTYDLALDPLNSSIVYLATAGGVFRTSDGGTTWSRGTAGMVYFHINAVAIDPVNTATIYAASEGGGVYKSTDAGGHWTSGNNGLGSSRVKTLVINPTNTANVYAGTDGGFDAFIAKINPSGSALVYSSYLGGADTDTGNGLAVDDTNNVYVGGQTYSQNFPTANALQPNNAGGSDAFVAKLNASGSALIYSTYFGGSRDDSALAIAIDRSGSAYFTGSTGSTDLQTSNPFQAACPSCSSAFVDAFVTRLGPGGASLIYSTYLGGDDDDFGTSIAVDANNCAYVTGYTLSTNFPKAGNLQLPNSSTFYDAFVTKLTPAGAALVYSTYLGGDGNDYGLGIAVDGNGNAYVVGETDSSTFPLASALKPSAAGNGGSDAFVTKLTTPEAAVSGRVTDIKGNGLADATLTISGAPSGQTISTQTDPDGYYAMNNSTGGDTLTASKPGYIFMGSVRAVSSRGIEPISGNFNFIGGTVIYKLSGQIIDGTGAPLPDVRLTVTGSMPGNELTDANGNYSISLFGGGNYTLTPSKDGYSFNPSSFVFNNLSADRTLLTIVGTKRPYNINGLVKDSGGNPVSGATVTLQRAGSSEPGLQALTSASGSYTFRNVAGEATYTVIAAKPGFSFNPPSVTFSNPVGNQTADFTASPATTLQFSAPTYSASEGDGSATITVTRAGDASGAATIEYATVGGSASERTDYTAARGVLTFAAGDVSQSFKVLLTDNAFMDGNRTVTLSLSNAVGVIISTPSAATLTIRDNDTASPTTNPDDDAQFFVRQQYMDFLNREPDAGGLGYWSNEITKCGADSQCLRDRRIAVSDAFFFEDEFQKTGGYVYRVFKAGLGQMPTYAQFMADRGRVVAGQNLDSTKSSYALAFVQRDSFLSLYPRNLSAAQFVDALLNSIKQNSGVDLSAQRGALISLYDGTDTGRAAILRQVADNQTFVDAEYNNSFTLMLYFGYLRRDPETGGFAFWRSQLDKYALRDITIQHALVCSFITSAEYQTRFSSVVTHSNRECPQ